MARVVIFDHMAFEAIAVVDVPDSYLLAVARRQEPGPLKLVLPRLSLNLRFEQVSTVTGKFFWMACATTVEGCLTLREAYIDVESASHMARLIERALENLVR